MPEHDNNETPGRAGPPIIDPNESMAVQSGSALMVATERGLLTYRCSIDTRSSDDADVQLIDQVRAELDVAGFTFTIPDLPGVYYLVFVTGRAGRHQPYLIPEGEVRSFVVAAALYHSAETASDFVYIRGTLPARREPRA